jgi:hypothetical protein
LVKTSELVKKILTFPESAVEWITSSLVERIDARRRYGRGFSGTAYTLLTIGTVLVVAFLLGGGTYLVIYMPSFLVGSSTSSLGASFIYRGNSLEETFLEGVFISMMYAFSVAGMYLIYRSTRYSHSPRTMWMIFIVGFAFLAIGSILIYQTAMWKMSG